MTASKIIAPLRKLNRRNVFMFLMLLGPGIITANVDNDAGGITTYSPRARSSGSRCCG
jgi:Mn2+/Fe2+ NRAMP family transporter